jgi:hypothetical protein
MIKRRGFITTTTALALLALAGVAMAQLTTAFATDARRTENERVEAQLRQVVIAQILQSRQNGPMQLPDELNKSDAKIAMQNKTIIAQIDRRHLQIELPPK